MTYIRPKIKLLSPELLQAIIDDAFLILKRSGVMVENAEARKLLLDAGAKLESGRVKIDSNLIEKCLKTVPSSIQLYDRDENL
ncbi:trimethylamine methyltransferase family protein, partial [bacterium]|nr:trimethylamine methyltransferase family protein [bacterium]